VIVRLADLADPGELAAVGELTVAAYRADGYLRGDDDFYVTHLRAAADRARQATLVVAVDESSSQVLGTVTYCRAGTPWAEVCEPGEAEFRMLAVDPAARGRGVGRRLTEWCIDRARADGASALVLSSLTVMRPG
jgi:ribosomal protein S18 acetylase RimI-like enzyme